MLAQRVATALALLALLAAAVWAGGAALAEVVAILLGAAAYEWLRLAGHSKRAGVVGAAVNLTSRVESYTLPGQILVSSRTRDAVRAPLRVARTLEVPPKGAREPMTLSDVVGIEGRWNLALTRTETSLVPLARPLAVRYAVIRGKSISGEGTEGAIVAQDAELTTLRLSGTQPVEPLDNLWVAVGDETARLMGKVTQLEPDGCVLHVTSLPEAWAARLRESGVGPA